MISNLIYVSARKQHCTESEIENILTSCQKNNKGIDVTGVLLYTNTIFVQYLEGEYDHIHTLYDKIKKDDRHSNVLKVCDSKIPKRIFPAWSMGSRRIENDKIQFDTKLEDNELEVFNHLLNGEEIESHRAIAILKRFFY